MLSSWPDSNTKMRVVNLQSEGKYSLIKARTARKDKQGEYHNSVWNFIRFVGKAHAKIDQLEYELNASGDTFENGDSMKGVWIELLQWGLQNESYEVNGETRYPKNYTIVVFDWDFPDKDGSGYKPPEVEEDDLEDDELPF